MVGGWIVESAPATNAEQVGTMHASNDATELIRVLQNRWSESFGRGDWDQLASLYAAEAHFFGGKPRLYRHRLDIQSYFELVPPGGLAIFQEDMAVSWLTPDLLMFSGFVDFRREDRLRMHRMTWIISRINSDWKIVGHHASPVPAS